MDELKINRAYIKRYLTSHIKDHPILNIVNYKMQNNQLKEPVHHMVIACISGDTEYLLTEINQLYSWFDLTKATQEELSIIKEVSLQASMDGFTSCLAVLYDNKLPMDELCPIIAACHGKKDVISFCENISLGNCQEAWNRYFDWMLCHGSQMDIEEEEENDITLASEWVSNYVYQNATTEIICLSK